MAFTQKINILLLKTFQNSMICILVCTSCDSLPNTKSYMYPSSQLTHCSTNDNPLSSESGPNGTQTTEICRNIESIWKLIETIASKFDSDDTARQSVKTIAEKWSPTNANHCFDTIQQFINDYPGDSRFSSLKQTALLTYLVEVLYNKFKPTEVDKYKRIRHRIPELSISNTYNTDKVGVGDMIETIRKFYETSPGTNLKKTAPFFKEIFKKLTNDLTIWKNHKLEDWHTIARVCQKAKVEHIERAAFLMQLINHLNKELNHNDNYIQTLSLDSWNGLLHIMVEASTKERLLFVYYIPFFTKAVDHYYRTPAILIQDPMPLSTLSTFLGAVLEYTYSKQKGSNQQPNEVERRLNTLKDLVDVNDANDLVEIVGEYYKIFINALDPKLYYKEAFSELQKIKEVLDEVVMEHGIKITTSSEQAMAST